MSRVWVVFLKELKETIRDRRTLLIMVVVPVLLYPALMIASEQLALFGMRQLEREPARVAVVGAAGDADLDRFLGEAQDLERVQLVGTEPAEAVRSHDVAAVAIFGQADRPRTETEGFPDPAALDGSTPITRDVQVLFDAADDRSRRGRDVLVAALGRWEESVLERRLTEQGLPAWFADPIHVGDSSVARPEEVGGYALGRFLPMLLIVITLLGTFYPAIDLAAGEKERGTLETLLTAPVPSREIVAGKFLTVAVVGVVAAGLNLLSMLLTFQTGLFQFGNALDIEFTLPLGRLLLIFVTLVPLAVLFGSLFLGVAVRARSFKEAQNALTPIYMLALMPAILPLFPGIEFTGPLAVAPIAGVALFFRELMVGRAPFGLGLAAVVSTAFYAWGALAFAASSFGREDVLFGGDATKRGPLRGLFRRAAQGAAAAVPTLGQALLFVAVVAALFFYVGIPLQARWLEKGLLATEWLLLFLPAVLFVRLGHFQVPDTLSLRLPHPRHVGGALLLIAGGTPIAWLLAWLQSFVLPVPWDLVEGLSDLVSAESLGRLVWLLVLVAVTPAICEEIVFRGVLLGGSRRTLSASSAVLLNGLAFGLFHVSTETVFRLLPTAWLGVILAWTVWRTRSILLSSMMHLLNNGTIVLLAFLPATRAWLSDPEFAPPVWLILPALMSFVTGIYLLSNDPHAPLTPDPNHDAS
ncbi:MAG: ABC transporter permease subunit/CPBP intramembrane protease [Gemmatimonadota bacterium]